MNGRIHTFDTKKLMAKVTIRVIAELTHGEIKFHVGKVVGHDDRFVVAGQQGDNRFSVVLDGKTTLAFADEIRKGVLSD